MKTYANFFVRYVHDYVFEFFKIINFKLEFTFKPIKENK